MPRLLPDTDISYSILKKQCKYFFFPHHRTPILLLSTHTSPHLSFFPHSPLFRLFFSSTLHLTPNTSSTLSYLFLSRTFSITPCLTPFLLLFLSRLSTPLSQPSFSYPLSPFTQPPLFHLFPRAPTTPTPPPLSFPLAATHSPPRTQKPLLTVNRQEGAAFSSLPKYLRV